MIVRLIVLMGILLQTPAFAECIQNPISEGFKFEQPIVKVYLDRLYSDYNMDGSLYSSHRGVINNAIEGLNEELVNIQLELAETDEDFTLQGRFNQCKDLPNTFECMDDLEAEMRKDYPNSIVLTSGPNSGGAGVFCSNGYDLDEVENCQETINFSYVSLGKNNHNLYDLFDQIDIAMHEIMHGLGLPHVFGPFQIGREGAEEGSVWFDTLAVATPAKGFVWKKRAVPIMDPIINRNSRGLKGTDLQNLYDKYGKPANRKTLVVNVVQENGQPAVAMNVALIHKRRHIIKSVARSTYDGTAVLNTTRGRYYILVRPMANADLGNGSSGVEGERRPFYEPSDVRYRYVCKRNRKTKEFKLCNNNKKKRLIRLRKDREITVVLD